MNRTRRVVLANIMTAGLGAGALIGMPSSQADEVPDVCVWAHVEVDNVTSTTLKVDTTGSTCPSLPPTPADPCPGGFPVAHVPRDVGVAAFNTLVCVKDFNP